MSEQPNEENSSRSTDDVNENVCHEYIIQEITVVGDKPIRGYGGSETANERLLVIDKGDSLSKFIERVTKPLSDYQTLKAVRSEDSISSEEAGEAESADGRIASADVTSGIGETSQSALSSSPEMQGWSSTDEQSTLSSDAQPASEPSISEQTPPGATGLPATMTKEIPLGISAIDESQSKEDQKGADAVEIEKTESQIEGDSKLDTSIKDSAEEGKTSIDEGFGRVSSEGSDKQRQESSQITTPMDEGDTDDEDIEALVHSIMSKVDKLFAKDF